MTGAFADRMLFKPYLVYIFCWVHLVYFPFCHWVWGPDGWLAKEGSTVQVQPGVEALAFSD